MAILILRYVSDFDYRFVFEVVTLSRDYGLVIEAVTEEVDYGELE